MKKLWLITGILLIAIAHPAFARIWRVNNVPEKNADFTTIAAAIAAAAPGDTLYIEPSKVSYGDVIVNKRLAIFGNGFFLTGTGLRAETDSSLVNNITLDSTSVTANASGSLISSLYFSNTIILKHNIRDVTIQRCFFPDDVVIMEYTKPVNTIHITQCFLEARIEGDIGSNGAPVSVLIENCIFSSAQGQGLGSLIFSTNFSGIVRNCTFNTSTPGFNTTNFTFAGNVFSGRLTSVFAGSNNVLRNNTFAAASISGVTNNVNGNITNADFTFFFVGDLFNDYGDGRFRTTPVSQLRGTGEPVGGITPDRGAYNTVPGIQGYQRGAIPPLPAISALVVPDAVSSTANSMQITVSASSADTALFNVTSLEWFIDHDPGIGNGTPITLSASPLITGLQATIPLTGITPGAHAFFIRTRDGGGGLSMTTSAPFDNSTILPLTWLYVTAAMNEGQAGIDWGTAQETGTARFEVEHSTDGRQFQTAATLPAAGNTTTSRSYHWVDPHPTPGMNYYRIRQLDLDGAYSYSKVVSLLYSRTGTRTIVTPNPANTRITLLLSAPADHSTATLYNTTGQPLQILSIPDGSTQQTIDLSRYPAGTYFVRLFQKNNTETIQVIKW